MTGGVWFDPDPHEEAVEIALLTKRHEIDHKHLGVVLERNFYFSAHINAAICKAGKVIGLLKYLFYIYMILPRFQR